MARKREIPCCSSHKSPKRKPTKPVSGNFQNTYTFLERRNQKKSFEGKYKEQPEFDIDGIENTIRTGYDKNLHRKLISTQLKFQRSPKKNVSPKKHTLREPGGKYMSASEKTKKVLEEGAISASKPEVPKRESDEDDSEFECHNISDGKPVLVDTDKEITVGEPALALLPSKSEEEEEINNNSET